MAQIPPADRKAIEAFLDTAPEELKGWADAQRSALDGPTRPSGATAPRAGKQKTSPWLYVSAALAAMLVVLGVYVFGDKTPAAQTMPSNHPDVAQSATPVQSQDLAQAQAEVESRIKANPKDSRAYIKLGGIFYQQGKYAEAKKQLDKAIEINPKDPDAYYALGFVLLQLDPPQPEAAKAAWEKVSQLAPGTELAKASAEHIKRLTQNQRAQTASPSAVPSPTPSK